MALIDGATRNRRERGPDCACYVYADQDLVVVCCDRRFARGVFGATNLLEATEWLFVGCPPTSRLGRVMLHGVTEDPESVWGVPEGYDEGVRLIPPP
jgi:hypothetical protein